MNRIYKYIIFSLLFLLFAGGITYIVLKNRPKEVVIPVPAETYYITVEKSIKTNYKGSYRKIFNDLNDVHIAVAQSYGVNPENVDLSVDTLSGKLQKVETSPYYAVDPLTHSHPYLVPHAKARLEELGKAFCDTLVARGGGGHRFIVTSVLRQNKDIKKLRRWNKNSTENSAHLYGTTVDITYRRFDKYTPQFIISDSDLKHLLAEILQIFQRDGKCYVKYEVKQGCFHITFR